MLLPCSVNTAGSYGPGLNFKIPILESVAKKVSIQNRSVELEFQAVTLDQANVYFKSMLLYSVQNADEETIKKVAFKFIADKDLMQALIRTIEGNIRSFVATKKQAEILGLRREIVEYVKVEDRSYTGRMGLSFAGSADQ